MRSHLHNIAAATAATAGVAAIALALLMPVQFAKADEHLHPPSAGAAGMPGALGTFEFKPNDWKGEGNTTYWTDTDGVAPGVAGCHIGRTADGQTNGRTFGEACTEDGHLVESNPGAEVLHAHADDIGHPDLFDCNAWCAGQGQVSGICTPAAAPPCAASAMCSCGSGGDTGMNPLPQDADGLAAAISGSDWTYRWHDADFAFRFGASGNLEVLDSWATVTWHASSGNTVVFDAPGGFQMELAFADTSHFTTTDWDGQPGTGSRN